MAMVKAVAPGVDGCGATAVTVRCGGPKGATDARSTVVASVTPYLPAGGTLRHEWAMEEGLGTFDDARAGRVVWTAPDELPGRPASRRLRLAYLGQDADGHQLIAFADVDVYMPGLLAQPVLVQETSGGCATAPGPWPLAALLALVTRRSPRDRGSPRRPSPRR